MRPVAAVALAGGAVAAGFAARRLAQPAQPTAAAPTPVDASDTAAAPDTAAAEATGVQQPRLAGARGHLPALEGLRGLAAIGIITTHVAFVTRMSYGTPVRRLYGRLDMLVAVFFAKTGFLLWRAHSDHARRDRSGTARAVIPYLRARLVRIMPAYTVLVAVAMVLLPQNRINGPGVWLRNLTLTQIYQRKFLVSGLTHAWSLAVEMAYYLALPALWTGLKNLRGDRARWRLPAVGAFGLSGLLFPLIPWQRLRILPRGVNVQILPPAFSAWFASGMLLAELATARPGLLARLSRASYARWGWWAAGAGALLATTSTRWFTEGFRHPSGREYAARNGLTAAMAFFFLGPVVLAPAGTRFRVLESPPLQAIGRWSYGIFLWHLIVLHYAFPLTRTALWTRRMGVIWPVTVAGSIAVGAASYRFIEEPARKLLSPHA
ncbi:acyltransferase family protein [Dietzia psychralcaliphila]|uniref:acyltransferase family protein n=1 Tax=Dietzia psychralcaliphila TaxID=139021 RepID=UPI001C1E14BE|nr:acyltransferase [Dietzia psychralcaliphila]